MRKFEIVAGDAMLDVPYEYEDVDLGEDALEGLSVIFLTSSEMAANVAVYSAADDELPPMFDEAELVDATRKLLGDRGAIIEVGMGSLASGGPYCYSLVKERKETPGTRYILRATLVLSNEIVGVQGNFDEIGAPGTREAAIYASLAGSDATREWVRDPYDPELRGAHLMNKGERPEYDWQYPENPLSKARVFLRHVVENN